MWGLDKQFMSVSRRKNEIRGYSCFLRWNMVIDNFKIMVSLGHVDPH